MENGELRMKETPRGSDKGETRVPRVRHAGSDSRRDSTLRWACRTRASHCGPTRVRAARFCRTGLLRSIGGGPNPWHPFCSEPAAENVRGYELADGSGGLDDAVANIYKS